MANFYMVDWSNISQTTTHIPCRELLFFFSFTAAYSHFSYGVTVLYEPYLAHVMFWREFLQVDALPIPNPPIYPGLGPALSWAGLPFQWLG